MRTTTATPTTPHQPADSTLRLLRGLIPDRTISQHERRHLAELQANRLRSSIGVADSLLRSEFVADLPHINVRFEVDLPTSGMSYWNGHTWIILLNPTEPETRHRFSLLHELHHIICHPKRTQLFGSGAAKNSATAEQMADYFAACALMPKLYVKRFFGQGTHDPHQQAEYFGVSSVAMAYRLDQLGLTTRRSRRCGYLPRFDRGQMKGAA